MGMLPRSSPLDNLSKRLGDFSEASTKLAIEDLRERLGPEVPILLLRYLATVGETKLLEWMASKLPDESLQTEAIGTASDSFALFVSEMYSASAIAQFLKRPRWIPKVAHRILCVIGKTPSGDPVVLVCRGPRKGSVGVVDHELAAGITSVVKKHPESKAIDELIERDILVFPDKGASDITSFVESVLDLMEESIKEVSTPDTKPSDIPELDELYRLVANEDYPGIARWAGGISNAVRSKLAPSTKALSKELVHSSRGYTRSDAPPLCLKAHKQYRGREEMREAHAATCLAVFACCDLRDIPKRTFMYEYDGYENSLAQILCERKPSWLVSWVATKLEAKVQHQLVTWKFVRALVVGGGIPKPTHEGYVQLLASPWSQILDPEDATPYELLMADPALLEDEVWRLFNTETMAFDRNVAPDWNWASSLEKLATEGHISADKLQVCAVRALEKPWRPSNRMRLKELVKALG